MKLTAQQLADFDELGYVFIPECFSADEIEVLRKPAALTLSLEAVHDIESTQPWVWSLDQQDRVQRTPVTLGVRAGSRVEVLSGLTVGARRIAHDRMGPHHGRLDSRGRDR